MSGSQICGPLIFCLLIFLFYDIHLVNQTLAVTKFLDNEKHVTDIDIDATLQVVVEVDIAAERLIDEMNIVK